VERRKAKRAQVDNAAEDPNEGDPESPADDADIPLSPKAKKRKRRTRTRVATPEGADDVTIVPSMVTMYELAARERRTGMKSEREKKMQGINWTEVKKRQREKELEVALRRGRKRTAEGSEDGAGTTDDEDAGDIDAQLAAVAASKRGRGVQIRFVNGAHVVDEQSQTVDRRAMARADLDALEEVEEDDLTRRFTARTHQNLRRREPAERVPATDRWSEADTARFYECLSRFGTDFLVVSKMFKGRSRRHIKAKFAREERMFPERVAAALVCERTEDMRWDLEVFRQGAGLEHEDFLDPEEVAEELRLRREEREVLIEEARRETEDLRRQKELAGELAGDVTDEEDEEDVAVDGEDVVETIEQDV
jgi:transcription factor TFIIIB component B''